MLGSSRDSGGLLSAARNCIGAIASNVGTQHSYIQFVLALLTEQASQASTYLTASENWGCGHTLRGERQPTLPSFAIADSHVNRGVVQASKQAACVSPQLSACSTAWTRAAVWAAHSLKQGC